jgi:hypothetical protein
VRILKGFEPKRRKQRMGKPFDAEALWLKRDSDEGKRVVTPKGEHTSKAGLKLAFFYALLLFGLARL